MFELQSSSWISTSPLYTLRPVGRLYKFDNLDNSHTYTMEKQGGKYNPLLSLSLPASTPKDPKQHTSYAFHSTNTSQSPCNNTPSPRTPQAHQPTKTPTSTPTKHTPRNHNPLHRSQCTSPNPPPSTPATRSQCPSSPPPSTPATRSPTTSKPTRRNRKRTAAPHRPTSRVCPPNSPRVLCSRTQRRLLVWGGVLRRRIVRRVGSAV